MSVGEGIGLAMAVVRRLAALCFALACIDALRMTPPESRWVIVVLGLASLAAAFWPRPRPSWLAKL